MTSTKKILLKSCDGEQFEVEEAVAFQSNTISNLLEDCAADAEIPLANVSGDILAKAIEYCAKHADVGSVSEEDLKKWEAEFVDVDQSTMYDLILAANYLDIPGLLDLTCQRVAGVIAACKDANEIREKFEIENDFNAEEEEEIRKENERAFQ